MWLAHSLKVNLMQVDHRRHGELVRAEGEESKLRIVPRAAKRFLGTARLLAGAGKSAGSLLDLHAPAKAKHFSGIAQDFCEIHAIDVSWSGSIPDKPSILVCNHLSWVDPILIAARIPLAAVAKSEVSTWPIVGPICSSMGVIYIRRGDAHSGARVLKEAGRILASGGSVLNFSEGTTSFGDDVLPFFRGIFGLASIAEIPVVPMKITLEDRDLAWVGDDPFIPNYLQYFRRPRVRASIKVLSPLCASSFPTAESFAEYTRRAIARA